MPTSVFCLASSLAQASPIVARLKVLGLSDQNISVLFPDKQVDMRGFASDRVVEPASHVGRGAGPIIGGALGMLAGLGMQVMPDIGPLVAAGPILAALSGAALGATVDGIASVIRNMGVAEPQAYRYEGKIKSGHILISAHAENFEQAKCARRIFEEAGAAEIISTFELRAICLERSPMNISAGVSAV